MMGGVARIAPAVRAPGSDAVEAITVGLAGVLRRAGDGSTGREA
jgi:hypothetical protein